MKKLQLFLSSIFIILCFGGAQVAFGQTDDYTVKPIIPENQTNKDLGYFDITLGAGKEQTLQVELSNNKVTSWIERITSCCSKRKANCGN
ncbi:WxL protein peptidoglycan domain-containing protein [Lactococcus cremoris]|nr:DUF916 domain-containing protein [Lactococcus cremoris]QRZ30118.1 cell surface protein [Lactococcus cremoris]